MKKNELNSYLSKSKKDLEKEIIKLKADFLRAKVDIASQKERNLKKAKNLKRKIAQLSTLIKYKDLEEKLKIVPEENNKK